MATLREYFDKDFIRVLTIAKKAGFNTPAGELEIPVQVHYEFDAPARFISIYIAQHLFWKKACEMAFDSIEMLLDDSNSKDIRIPPPQFVFGGFHCDNGSKLVMESRPLLEPPIPSTALPFRGTLFIYSENLVSEADLLSLKALANSKNIWLRWRGPAFAQQRSLGQKPVAFISFDSRDRELARQIAIQLGQKLCPVWFDEFALVGGDSLREKIEKGLKECAHCLLLLSPNFLSNKGWTKTEFESIFMREIIKQENVILPVWCDVNKEEVYEYCPMLSGRKGLDGNLPINELCDLIYRTIARITLLPDKHAWEGRH